LDIHVKLQLHIYSDFMQRRSSRLFDFLYYRISTKVQVKR